MWLEHHRLSEDRASRADIARQRGEPEAAVALYAEAAAAETRAFDAFDGDDDQLRSILALGAASLHYKAGDLDTASRLAYGYLGRANALPHYASQMEHLLNTIRFERDWQGARLADPRTRLRFSLRGGETMHGGVPADVLEAPRRAAVALVTRAIEFGLSVAYRSAGKVNLDTLRQFRPWILQAPAGSYQFDVAVQPPAQRELMPSHEASAESVVQSSAEILAAASQSPDAILPEIVPNADYRRAFLKIAKDLTPDDRGFRQLEVRTPSHDSPIVLRSISREIITDAIKRLDVDADPGNEQREDLEISGILRNVHLDSEWIEVRVDAMKHRITGFNEDLATQAGGFLNQNVILSVQRDQAGKLHFREINAAD